MLEKLLLSLDDELDCELDEDAELDRLDKLDALNDELVEEPDENDDDDSRLAELSTFYPFVTVPLD